MQMAFTSVGEKKLIRKMQIVGGIRFVLVVTNIFIGKIGDGLRFV